MALAFLASDWARKSGRTITALTVDHGLRPEAAAEAAQVAAWCGAAGIRHRTLRVRGSAPGTALQEWARNRRFECLARWAGEHDGAPVLLAHTLDDQAETLLMRLFRGAGVDGLASMRADCRRDGVRVIRPLLTVSRQRLRATLLARERPWIEDPSNRDAKFERVRVRQAMRELEIDPAALARTAGRLERARSALDAEAGRFLQGCAARGALGEVIVDLGRLASAEEEIATRAIARSMRGVAGRGWLPVRRSRLESVVRWTRSPDTAPVGRTLAGCVLRKAARGRLLVLREPARCEPPIPLRAGQEALWDRRWRVWFDGSGSVDAGVLGRRDAERLEAASPEWRRSPILARASAPAFRRSGEILAVPAAGVWREGGPSEGGSEIRLRPL